MVAEPTLSDWDAAVAARFGCEALLLGHRLDRSPLFSLEALAALIDAYPRAHYALVQTGAAGDERLWREGDCGGLSGAEVITAIEAGRMWLNLRNLSKLDARYRALVEAVIGELARFLPGFAPWRVNCGLVISSPRAEVYYHADMPGHMLLQLMGRKRMWIYPVAPPFLTPEQLEDIAVFDLEVGLPYERGYDAAAQVFDLGPGQMLHWPLNAPHRIENEDSLNVSLTISYQTEAIRRAGIVRLANGILRHRFGLAPSGHALSGPSFWAKAALHKAMRDSAWMQRRREPRCAIQFRLDPDRPGATIELAEVA